MNRREQQPGSAAGSLEAERWVASPRIRVWILWAIAILVPVTAGAHKYISLPVLVNICGSHDHAVTDDAFESREEYVEAIKTQIEMARKDINLRLLDEPPEGVEEGVALRLGPITWRDLESCPDEVTQGTAELRRLFADGRKELASRLASKGVKVNVVNVVRETPKAGETEGRAIAAVGETGAEETVKTPAGGTEKVHHGRNVAIDDHTLTYGPELLDEDATEPELCGRNGEILLHEIGHNSGLVLQHGQEDANETGFMTTPPTRAISKDQWEKLRRFWQRFGESSANEEQHSYVPRTDDTHFAHVTQPGWAATPSVESFSVAIDPTGWLRGQVELTGLLPSAGLFGYEVGLAVDSDNNAATCGQFGEFGPGFDFLATVSIYSGAMGSAPADASGRRRAPAADGAAATNGSAVVFGTLTYLSGFQHVSVPLGAVALSEIGSIGAGAQYEPHAHTVTFAHDISGFPISPGVVPAKARLVYNGFSAGFVMAALQPVRDPDLPSLPVTVPAFGPVSVTGTGFAENSSVSVFLSHVRSFASEPVATTSTDGAGGFGLLVDVDGSRAGDYLVAAIDEEGNLATGVVTADVPCALECTAQVASYAWVNAPVLFASSVTSSFCADPTVIEWSFGDGSPAVAQPDLTHSYGTSGVYPWTFTASSGSATCRREGSLIVIDPATAVRRKLRRH